MVRWYVMHSKPQKEAFLRERLRIQRDEPFFPGYLFVDVDLEEISISELRGIPGSIGIVSYGGERAYIGDALILAIQKQVNEINDSVNFYVDRFRPVDLVVINDGPFANSKALFDCRLSGSDRVRVLLELLQGQQIRLELSGRQLQTITS
jgi:transcription antitermination factor NusG